VISPASWYGALLSGVFNFTPAPTVLQVIVWVGYVVATLAIFLQVSRPRAAAVVQPA
jgi:high-affinity iron transporter